MQFLTLVNRTSRNLTGTWDGKQYTVQPGKSQHPAIIARKIKYDNPIKGSDDPSTGVLQYLCGLEEEGDDCSPVEQSDEIELYNRSLIKNAQPIVIVAGDQRGLYASARSPLPVGGQIVDGSFRKD